MDPGELDMAWAAMLERLNSEALSEVISSAQDVLKDINDRITRAETLYREEVEREQDETRRLRALLYKENQK